MKPEERFAPDGQLWVCTACGKTAKDRYGIEGAHSYGWDESCALNAVLVPQSAIVEFDEHGRVTEMAVSP